MPYEVNGTSPFLQVIEGTLAGMQKQKQAKAESAAAAAEAEAKQKQEAIANALAQSKFDWEKQSKGQELAISQARELSTEKKDAAEALHQAKSDALAQATLEFNRTKNERDYRARIREITLKHTEAMSRLKTETDVANIHASAARDAAAIHASAEITAAGIHASAEERGQDIRSRDEQRGQDLTSRYRTESLLTKGGKDQPYAGAQLAKNLPTIFKGSDVPPGVVATLQRLVASTRATPEQVEESLREYATGKRKSPHMTADEAQKLLDVWAGQ